jgi:hypothetical protein
MRREERGGVIPVSIHALWTTLTHSCLAFTSLLAIKGEMSTMGRDIFCPLPSSFLFFFLSLLSSSVSSMVCVTQFNLHNFEISSFCKITVKYYFPHFSSNYVIFNVFTFS